MARSKFTFTDWLQSSIIRTCRVHFVFLACYAVYTIASDATNLITPQFVFNRLLASGLLLVVVAVVWNLARRTTENSDYYRKLVWAIVTADIAMATFNIYTQRGMASRAVILFTIPIIVSAVLLSRVAVFTTALISIAAYVLAARKYFDDFFNEGGKSEFYIEVGFYCATFLIVAALLSVLVKFNRPETKA